MKTILVLSILFCAIALSARGELTDADLDKIRLIIKEEVKTESAASEKRLKEYIDLKVDAVEEKLSARIDSTNTRIDGLDKRMSDMWRLMMGLFGLVAATIAIPQIIVAYRDRGRRELQTEIQQLRERLEALENTPS